VRLGLVSRGGRKGRPFSPCPALLSEGLSVRFLVFPVHKPLDGAHEELIRASWRALLSAVILADVMRKPWRIVDLCQQNFGHDRVIGCVFHAYQHGLPPVPKLPKVVVSCVLDIQEILQAEQ
jgi:hypothetical protein